MSRQRFLIVAPFEDKCFFAGHGDWVSEYPDAHLFQSLDAAERARDRIAIRTAIYEEIDYAEGNGPTGAVQP
jgi:hypothetical protein